MNKLRFAVLVLAGAVCGPLFANEVSLPAGYVADTFLSSSGAWYDTGYVPQSTDRLELKFYLGNASAARGIFCARGTGASDRAYACSLTSAGSFRYDYGAYDADRKSGVLSASAVYTLVFDGANAKATVTKESDGSVSERSFGAVTNFTAGSTLALFAMRTTDAQGKETISLCDSSWVRGYSVRVWDRFGDLKMRLVPCHRLLDDRNETHGFYDLVNDRFIAPRFVKDSNVVIGKPESYAYPVSEPQELKYVDSTGYQWFRTDLTPHWSDKVVANVRSLVSEQDKSAGGLYWCRDTAKQKSFSAFVNKRDANGKGTLRTDRLDTGYTTTSAVFPYETDVELIYNGKTGKTSLTYAGGSASGKDAGTGSYTVGSPMALLVAHSGGADLSSASITSDYAGYCQPWRIYGFKVVDTNGVAKIDLIPARDRSGAEGVVGLYDRVSGLFYPPVAAFNKDGVSADNIQMIAGPSVEESTSVLSCAVNESAKTASFTFAASAVSRKLVLAYGNADKGAAVHAWANQVELATVAAGATELGDVALPEGYGAGYRAFRAFLGGVVSSETHFAPIKPTVKVVKEGGQPVGANLICTGSTAARRLFLVWGPKDVGNTLTGWVGKAEIAGGLEAGVTEASVDFPEEAKAYLAEQGGFRLVIGDVATSKSYVSRGLFLQYDGLDNAGFGKHDPVATMWKDLVSTNDISIAETDETYPTMKDQVCDTYVKIRRHTRATEHEVIGARPDVQLTMESCMRPVTHEGTANVATIDLRYYGYMGWDKRETGSMMLCRPVSTARTQRDLRKYDIGGASLQALINAAAFNTYSVTLGYGGGSSAASLAYFDGELCGPHGAGSTSDSSDWSRQLKLGFQKSVTDIASVRLYDRELSLEDRRWNVAVDEERFRGGDPASLQSTDFIRRARGLIIVVE